MAKIFYTAEETKKKLGVADDGIDVMVTEGTLHQYRDRDQLFYRCDEVDAIALHLGDIKAADRKLGDEI